MTLTVWDCCRVCWMCVSTGLVVLNKYLLSNVGFCYPMALSGMGMAFSSVASFIACKVRSAPLPPNHAVTPSSPRPKRQGGSHDVHAPACCNAPCLLTHNQTCIRSPFDMLLFELRGLHRLLVLLPTSHNGAAIPVRLQFAKAALGDEWMIAA